MMKHQVLAEHYSLPTPTPVTHTHMHAHACKPKKVAEKERECEVSENKYATFTANIRNKFTARNTFVDHAVARQQYELIISRRDPKENMAWWPSATITQLFTAYRARPLHTYTCCKSTRCNARAKKAHTHEHTDT